MIEPFFKNGTFLSFVANKGFLFFSEREDFTPSYDNIKGMNDATDSPL